MRDVAFNNLPGVFRKFVLPVSAQCRQSDQQTRRQEQSDGGHGSFVRPFLHADLDSSTARFRRDFDCEGRSKSGHFAQCARLSRLQHGG